MAQFHYTESLVMRTTLVQWLYILCYVSLFPTRFKVTYNLLHKRESCMHPHAGQVAVYMLSNIVFLNPRSSVV